MYGVIHISIMTTVHPELPGQAYRVITMEERISETMKDTYYILCRICEMHRFMIIVCVVCLAVGSIVITVVIKSNNTNISPCFYYKEDTLASDVSITCVKYLWSSFQCTTVLESSPTWHWWIQSPQGLTMVKCDAYYTGTACGAGSYSNIRNYISLCNPRFGQ